jgi:hypothetical protein
MTLIVAIIVVWIMLSGFLLLSVCMMSSVANRTDLLDREQLPPREVQAEVGSNQETPGQQTAKSPTW